MIIGIHGKKRVGKDTLGNIMVEEYGFARIAFADPLRQMLDALLIPPEYKEEKKLEVIPRLGKTYTEIMQNLGTDWGRTFLGEEVWIQVADVRRKLFQDKVGYKNIVYTDVRYDNEAKYIHGIGGRIIHLVGDRGVSVNSHSSEASIHPSFIDYVLYNNGTIEELAENATNLMEQLGV